MRLVFQKCILLVPDAECLFLFIFNPVNIELNILPKIIFLIIFLGFYYVNSDDSSKISPESIFCCHNTLKHEEVIDHSLQSVISDIGKRHLGNVRFEIKYQR